MLKEQLEKIGLTDKEAKVFLASLELGSDTIQKRFLKIAKTPSLKSKNGFC